MRVELGLLDLVERDTKVEVGSYYYGLHCYSYNFEDERRRSTASLAIPQEA